MNRGSLLVLLLFGCSIAAFPQNPLAGSANGVFLDGTTYLQLGEVYDELEIPVTVEAWIKMESTLTDWGPVFVSQEGDPEYYYGFWLFAKKNGFSIGYGDGRGGYHPAYRRSKTWVTNQDLSGRWIHLAAVIRGATDMSLYVNGIDIGGDYTGYSGHPMMNMDGQLAKIGVDNQNTKVYYYEGSLDELRIWNSARSLNAIRQNMNRKLSGQQQYLVGYWRMDELNSGDFPDWSSSGISAQNSGTSHMVSGAPIGDESINLYTGDWPGKELQLTSSEGSVKIEDISPNSNIEGIQLYRVNSLPNSLDNLSLTCLDDVYYGVFLCSVSKDSTNYSLNLDTESLLNVRRSNEISSWQTNPNAASSFDLDSQRFEAILASSDNIPVEFEGGILCVGEKLQYILPDEYSYTLNSNPVSNIFEIDIGGNYVLEATGECGTDTFEMSVQEVEDPTISIIQEYEICAGEEITLIPSELTGALHWSTGETGESIVVSDPGVYTATALNECGSQEVTIEVKPVEVDSIFIPNVITPNADGKNDLFVLDERLRQPELEVFNRWGREVYSAAEYRNDWGAKDLNPGTYFYIIYENCNRSSIKGYLHIIK